MTVTVGVRLDPEFKQRLDDQARLRRTSTSALVRDLMFLGLERASRGARGLDRPYGQHRPRDNSRSRRTLPSDVSDALLEAHLRSGQSYRAMADCLGLDVAMWWRLTRGERCPSRAVAERICRVLDLDEDVARELLDAAV